MQRYLLATAATLMLFLSGCANDNLEPDTTDRGPAGYSPDPMRHIPNRTDGTEYGMGGTPRI